MNLFCHACLEDKPATEASPDPRYCQGCYDFLLQEAEMLNPGKYPGWVPKDSQSITRPPPEPLSPPFSASKTNTGEEDKVLNMSTVKCPIHLDTTMELTDWRPPEGWDPGMRQFECPVCHRFSYKMPSGLEGAQKPHLQTAK